MEPNSKEWWCFSILSDAQELLRMGLYDDACDKIRDAKLVLLGKYKILQDGFCIQVERGEQK